MKGVILAGGKGTRLYPLTHATNKHLLPVFNQPMIYYPIQTLVNAGITEIMIVVSGPHAGHFIRVLKNGEEMGIDTLEYGYQENPKGGIADALAIAEDFADNEPITVILGDNTTDADISDAVNSFEEGAKVFLKKVPDPERFGVPVFDPEDKTKIISLEEKPENPKTNYAVTGLYIYDSSVFDLIKRCDPDFAGRGELEITEVNDYYAKEGKLSWAELDGYWRDAGKFETLFEVNKYWKEKWDKQKNKK
jgi:glucose-1-phosphate thymidylyltransferase